MNLKKFIFLLLFNVCLIGQAQELYNNLIVKSDDSIQFTITINDFQQNLKPHNSIKITNIYDQSISLTINTTDSIKQTIEKQLFFELKGKETIAKLISKDGLYKFRFISEVNIGQAAIDTTQLSIPYNENNKYKNDLPIINNDTINNDSTLINNTSSISPISYNGKTGCNAIAGSAQSIIDLLNKEIFSDQKLKLAKKEIQKSCLPANDISKIINIFEFDDLKLELAKFSYKYTFDIDNYNLVIESLDFDSSKKSLTDYIEKL